MKKTVPSQWARRFQSQFSLVALQVAFLLSFGSNPCGCADSTELLERIYKMGDYGAAAKLARELIVEQPNNVLAHYYLAGAMVKLGRASEAADEYRRCISLGQGTSIEAIAKQGLRAISTKVSLPRAGAAVSELYGVSSSKPVAASRPLTTPPSSGPEAGPEAAPIASGKNLDNKIDHEIALKRKILLQAEAKEKKAAIDRFDSEVKRLQSDCKGEEEVLKARTQVAFEKYTAECNTIEQRYRKAADDLLKSRDSMTARSKDESASVRPVAGGSGMYLQNYETLGDESRSVGIPSENPLTATPEKLGGSKLRSAKSTRRNLPELKSSQK